MSKRSVFEQSVGDSLEPDENEIKVGVGCEIICGCKLCGTTKPTLPHLWRQSDMKHASSVIPWQWNTAFTRFLAMGLNGLMATSQKRDKISTKKG